MDTFGINELQALMGEQATPCVSIYLPTHPSGEAGQQDAVRMKNLLRRAETQLTDTWLRAVEARELLQPAAGLSTDPAFWGERSNGLAIFVAPGTFFRFRLPSAFAENLFVNRRFHVKPLLPLVDGDDRFFILALSQNNVRLLQATRYTIVPVEVAGLPTNMKGALNYAEADRGSQAHSAMRGSMGKQAAVFHGHGGQPDTRKDDLVQFLRKVDSALTPLLRDKTTPLLLTGVEYVLSLYREINRYPHVLDQELTGNCDYLSDHELHQKAWPVVESELQRSRERAILRYRESSGSGKTSEDIKPIIRAARDGRIDTLFVKQEGNQWGVVDAESGEVDLHDTCESGDDDLLDVAAVMTLSQRGTVYSLDREQMPGAGPIAAIFRY